MLNKKIILYVLLFIMLISIAYAIPGTWYGFVTINGLDAPNSTNVSIFLNNAHITTVQTSSVDTAPDHYYIVAMRE